MLIALVAAVAARVAAPSIVTTSGSRAGVVGVAFFDFLHGQAGVAPNGIELHPVLGSPASRARKGQAFYVPRTKMGRPAHDNSGRNPESADTAKNWNRALGRSRKLRRFRERAPGSVLRG